MIFCSAKCS